MTPSSGVFRINGYNSVRRINSKKPDTGVDWWLAGEIAPANCIAAYQPKGVASYAASKVNLANPGTYDATEGSGTITWNTNDGWIFDAVNDRIDTGITIPGSANSLAYTVIIRANPLSNGSDNFYGRLIEAAVDFLILPRTAQGIYFSNGGTIFDLATNLESDGVVAISKNKGYINGSYEYDIPNGSVTESLLYIGNRASSNRGFDGYIKSFSIYNIELTAPQVLAVTTAMAAL